MLVSEEETKERILTAIADEYSRQILIRTSAEGFDELAKWFDAVAEAEKIHAKKVQKMAKASLSSAMTTNHMD